MVDWPMYFKANGVPPSLGESIVSFNMETGEFRTVEVPELFDVSPQHIKYPEEEFHLFEMEGELSLFGTSSAKEVVIWVRSYGYFQIDNCWVKKHSITSPDQERYWNFNSYFRDFVYIKMKGEFIAYDRWEKKKQTLIYNLSLGTWKLFEMKEFQHDRFVITSHTHSLVSLDAADSVIPLQCWSGDILFEQ
ncbi:hypothetical protein MKW98_019405 [Papaver atlanticum]|uniref:F-box protein n=1 Tax=Papaver atlanticum TaxID=357466 RepID=A0AAD4S9A7_9MAGN|nr:hypothetical protein MKW98_019405 [Papaver atlanticum]